MATKKGTFQDYQGNELCPDLPAQELLEKIKTVDGPGSGLDADLLDGKQASEFAASNHTHTPASIGAAAASHTHTPSSIGAAAASHSHPAGQITAGILPTGVLASGGTDYSASRLRNIKASTSDLSAGSSSLANGEIYLVYE